MVYIPRRLKHSYKKPGGILTLNHSHEFVRYLNFLVFTDKYNLDIDAVSEGSSGLTTYGTGVSVYDDHIRTSGSLTNKIEFVVGSRPIPKFVFYSVGDSISGAVAFSMMSAYWNGIYGESINTLYPKNSTFNTGVTYPAGTGVIAASKQGTNLAGAKNGTLTTPDNTTDFPTGNFDRIKLGQSFLDNPSVVDMYFIGFGSIDVPDEALIELSRNPYQLLKPKRRYFYIPSASGLLLSGNALAESNATADITTQIPLAAASTSISTVNGSLSTQLPLSGSAASISIADGQLTTKITLSGNALSEVIASAILSGGIGLSADAAAQSNAVGDITTQITLSGAALSVALAGADLTAGGGTLAGNAEASAGAAGLLTTSIPLLGNATATATVQGGLTTDISLQAVAISAHNVSGGLTTQITFNATALAQSLMVGDLTAQQAANLSGAALAEALAGATLTTNITLSGIAIADAIASGSLSEKYDSELIFDLLTVSETTDYFYVQETVDVIKR